MEIVDGGVTSAKGFTAAGVAAEIKYKGRADMALIYSAAPCNVAGTFTTNVAKAAPVKWDEKIVREVKSARAVVVNSGIANACTGKEGYGYCEETAKETAGVLGISPSDVLVCSTGVIGEQLPMDRIKSGIKMLAERKEATRKAASDAAGAIMTTDMRRKEIAVTFVSGGKKVTVGGMAKGSGMIHPNMCTMLSFITTDAAITGAALQKALSEDVADTYNMISVDADTSTNDTVLVLANGMAGNEEIVPGSDDYRKFAEALHEVNLYLAKCIAGDGEGATTLIEAKVTGADTGRSAKILARSIVSSNLTKAAIAGHDANWGRIFCAMGYSGVSFDPDRVDIFIQSGAGQIQLVRDGIGTDFDEKKATEILSAKEVVITADLKEGDCEATAWGCDLTHGYVDINSSYRG